MVACVVLVVGVGAGASTVHDAVATALPVQFGLRLTLREDVRDLLVHFSGQRGYVLPDGSDGAVVVDV